MLTSMVIYSLFLRWAYVKHVQKAPKLGGFFYLIADHGPRARAAEARPHPCGGLYYQACASFVNQYGELLGLTPNLVWSRREHVVVWLKACIHNSFMRHSVRGVGHCWYLKSITEADLQGQMVLPEGLRNDVGSTSRGIWALLKHGNEFWPIRIANNVMQNGWVAFRREHQLEPGYKVILVCDRKWVFTVTILSATNTQRWYEWSTGFNPYWRNLHVPEVNLPTALLPMVVATRYPLLACGYEYLPETNHHLEFERCIYPLLEIPDVVGTVIQMGAKQWPLAIMDHRVSPLLFAGFLLDVQLQHGDYIVVALMSCREIRVIIMDGATKCERLYHWF